MLEACQHEQNAFVTLTYGDGDLPAGGSLSPADLQGWLKRYRERIAPTRIRFFATGEYSPGSERPHYHVAVFGQGCELGPYRIGERGRRYCACKMCSDVRASWTSGHSLVGELKEKSAAYIAGYVLKKLGSELTESQLAGRHPEFGRMSLKPGIGAGAVPDVASAVMQYKLDQKLGDVPSALRHGRSVMPLGRYLRNKLRLECGLPEGCPEHVIEAVRAGLLPVFDYADATLPHPSMGRFKRTLVREAFAEINRQENVIIEARNKIRRSL